MKMKYSKNSINILTAKTYKGIGKAWIIKNLKGNESIDTIVSLLNIGSKEEGPITKQDFVQDRQLILNELLNLSEFMDGITAIGDENFPAYRGNVNKSEQPIVIFYKGDISLLNVTNNNIAVIGLLNPDNDTEIIENKVVDELVKKGVTIVSGLALGCDTIAHKQALRSNGKTVAILPSPLSNISPASNKELAKEIVDKNGLLITEYYKNANSKMEFSGRYQERDRLQALFSNSIVLTASYAKNNIGNDSGSRLAMGYASKYAIPRAVIYEADKNNANPKYDLNRQLINEDKKVTIIGSDNLDQTIMNLITLKPVLNENNFQQKLFNF